MLVLHINSSQNGGAGKAAIRLHKFLQKNGIKSMFLSLDSNTNYCDSLYRYNQPKLDLIKPEAPPLTFKNYLKERIFHTFSKKQKEFLNKKKEVQPPVINGEYEIVTSPITMYDITNCELYKQADIIHLHWISDYLDYESFFRKNKKPIIWTFHDLNPILGCFHYFGDVFRNSNNKFEEYFKNIKKNALSKAYKINIIAPSLWLKKCIENSFYSKFSVQNIYNYVDKDIFKQHDKKTARNIFNLPENSSVFLFSAQTVRNYRKGFDVILPIINSEKYSKVNFLILGEYDIDFFLNQKNVFFTGTIHDDRLLALAYSAADYFLLPSREDNLPNTMVESLLCGTPVIAFDISDNKYILENNKIGLISNEISTKGFEELIQGCLNNEHDFDRNYISQKAISLFSNDTFFIDFYNELYNKSLGL